LDLVFNLYETIIDSQVNWRIRAYEPFIYYEAKISASSLLPMSQFKYASLFLVLANCVVKSDRVYAN